MTNKYAVSAEEWQLLSFFEVEPTRLDPDISWPYNSFTYRRSIDDLTVTFSVAPALKDFTLAVERGSQKEIDLTALAVFDVRYHQEHGSEWLEILLTEDDRVELRLKPSLSLIGQLRHVD